MWDELVRGAIGAVVMVDTRRLADCFAAIDFFEHRRLPYLVAINCFDGMQYHSAQDVRDALAVATEVPVIACDARSRESTKHVLISLVEYVLTMRRTRAGAPA
jgi:signal recognition particle receptor subunit beta